MDNNFSAKLLRLRKNAKLNQKQLGELIGVTDRAVSKWECGLSRPSLEACVALAGIFKIPVDELIAGEKNKEEKKSSYMASLRELYRVGPGPSSSHTIAPARAAKYFLKAHPDADSFKVILYGSLAKTGYGHGTEKALKTAFDTIPNKVELDYLTTDIKHPNTMDFLQLSC